MKLDNISAWNCRPMFFFGCIQDVFPTRNENVHYITDRLPWIATAQKKVICDRKLTACRHPSEMTRTKNTHLLLLLLPRRLAV
jgi:hypothetical protein